MSRTHTSRWTWAGLAVLAVLMVVFTSLVNNGAFKTIMLLVCGAVLVELIRSFWHAEFSPRKRFVSGASRG